MDVPQIDVAEAKKLFDDKSATFVDVRDPDSYFGGRIPGATRVHGQNVDTFQNEADKEHPHVIYCFHGKTSQGATEQFLEKGFKTVYSMAGGFGAWGTASYPTESGAPEARVPEGFAVSELAKTKLDQYLKGEAEGTRMRIVTDGGSWGLALDSASAGDSIFSADGVDVVVNTELLESLAKLKIGFTEEVNKAGFKFEGPDPPAPPGNKELLAEIKELISSNKVMLFMKGSAGAPQCGFSARCVDTLKATGKPFGDKNILEIPEYRYVLSEHSSWPTIPQIFIDGKFVGGCDILMELNQSGELQKLVDAAYA